MKNYKKTNLYIQEYEQIVTELTSVGVCYAEAEIVADCFATADVFGVTTHGFQFCSHI